MSESIRETVAGSLDRQKMWEAIGKPISPAYMTEADMDRHYRGRFTCIDKRVLEEAQRAMQFVSCPSCVKVKSYGEIAVTRFHISVIDDPMTTFKALARCFCYNCAFEEFWPLTMDPRPNSHEMLTATEIMARQQDMMNQAMNMGAGQYGGPLNRDPSQRMGMRGNALGAAAGNALSAATRQEYDSLQRLYRDAVAAQQAKLPPTVKESIKQKLLDAMLGK